MGKSLPILNSPILPEPVRLSALSTERSTLVHDGRTVDHFKPYLVALNLTKRCNLKCDHCYLDATTKAAGGDDELSTEECYRLIEQIAEAAGKKLYISSLSDGASSGTSAASVIINIIISKFDSHDYTADSVFIPMASVAVQDGNTTMTLPLPLVVSAGEIFGMSFSTDKAARVVVAWFGWLENA